MTRTLIRSSGRIPKAIAAFNPAHPSAYIPCDDLLTDDDDGGPAGYRADPTWATLRAHRGALPAPAQCSVCHQHDAYNHHHEGLAWCTTCLASASSAGGVKHADGCQAANIIGAHLPAPLDGPRATAEPRHTLAASQRGTGAQVAHDTSPALSARVATESKRDDTGRTISGSSRIIWATRTQGRRADGGRIVIKRLSPMGHLTLAKQRAHDALRLQVRTGYTLTGGQVIRGRRLAKGTRYAVACDAPTYGEAGIAPFRTSFVRPTWQPGDLRTVRVLTSVGKVDGRKAGASKAAATRASKRAAQVAAGMAAHGVPVARVRRVVADL